MAGCNATLRGRRGIEPALYGTRPGHCRFGSAASEVQQAFQRRRSGGKSFSRTITGSIEPVFSRATTTASISVRFAV